MPHFGFCAWLCALCGGARRLAGVYVMVQASVVPGSWNQSLRLDALVSTTGVVLLGLVSVVGWHIWRLPGGVIIADRIAANVAGVKQD